LKGGMWLKINYLKENETSLCTKFPNRKVKNVIILDGKKGVFCWGGRREIWGVSERGN